MKILTREALEKILDKRGGDNVYAAELLDEDMFYETDEFTVSNLRPMSALDDYDGVDVLAYNTALKRFVHLSYDNITGGWMIYELIYAYYDHDKHAKEFPGFIPMPEYKPEGKPKWK